MRLYNKSITPFTSAAHSRLLYFDATALYVHNVLMIHKIYIYSNEKKK